MRGKMSPHRDTEYPNPSDAKNGTRKGPNRHIGVNTLLTMPRRAWLQQTVGPSNGQFIWSLIVVAALIVGCQGATVLSSSTINSCFRDGSGFDATSGLDCDNKLTVLMSIENGDVCTWNCRLKQAKRQILTKIKSSAPRYLKPPYRAPRPTEPQPHLLLPFASSSTKHPYKSFIRSITSEYAEPFYHCFSNCFRIQVLTSFISP